jgi:hypothetical protein
LDLFAVFVLALGLGLVLGYWSAMPRVKVLEKRLALQKGWVQGKDSQQEWPRAQGWKNYQDSLKAQESELNSESDRQQAEKVRWIDPPVQGTSQ